MASAHLRLVPGSKRPGIDSASAAAGDLTIIDDTGRLARYRAGPALPPGDPASAACVFGGRLWHAVPLSEPDAATGLSRPAAEAWLRAHPAELRTAKLVLDVLYIASLQAGDARTKSAIVPCLDALHARCAPEAWRSLMLRCRRRGRLRRWLRRWLRWKLATWRAAG
jgi:hypothetical protein